MHKKFKKNIWITEWGCATYGGGSCDSAHITKLMKTTTAWLDKQSWVEK